MSHRVLSSECDFFFNDTATTEIYTLSLHDALPIWPDDLGADDARRQHRGSRSRARHGRSEEHTSELQSLAYLVCRLPLDNTQLVLLVVNLSWPPTAGHTLSARVRPT